MKTLLIASIVAAAAVGAAIPETSHAGVSVGLSVGTPVLSVGYGHGHVGPRRGVYRGPRWSVGAWVPVLPIGYSTYYWGGYPYYTYDDSYFVSERRGYRVVSKPVNETVVSEPGPAPVISAPPADLPSGTPTPTFEQPARTGQLTAYPNKGQSASTATFDRIECETEGSKATGFRPGQSPDDAGKKAAYTSAVKACLEGRGYTVK